MYRAASIKPGSLDRGSKGERRRDGAERNTEARMSALIMYTFRPHLPYL